MLTTIEEKLSAIKAINQQKDTLEEMMSLMNRHQYHIDRIDVTSDRLFYPDKELQSKIWMIIMLDLEAKHSHLIDKAQELMK